MKTQYSILSCLIALLALPVLGALADAPAGFSIQVVTTFDYPGSGNSTQPQKINDGGDIVGLYADSSLIQRGFIRFRNGNFSAPLVDPNDTGGLTQGRGINNSRRICGDYLDSSSGNYFGFFLAGSTFHDYVVPGSSWTIALGLNNAGDFCGSDIPASGAQSGYVSIGGVITEFTAPRATNTLAYQINASNQACGYFIDTSAVTHGYYRNSDGSTFSPIDPVGSTGTIIFGNNNANWIVGRYTDASGATHGLLFVPPSRYITYDFPGSNFTSLNGINTQGQIVGRYLDGAGIEHGILAEVVRTASDQSTGGVTPRREAPQAAPGRGTYVEPAL